MQLEFMGGNKAPKAGGRFEHRFAKSEFQGNFEENSPTNDSTLFSFFLFLASEKYVDYFHLFAFCDGFQTGLESQG